MSRCSGRTRIPRGPGDRTRARGARLSGLPHASVGIPITGVRFSSPRFSTALATRSPYLISMCVVETVEHLRAVAGGDNSRCLSCGRVGSP